MRNAVHCEYIQMLDRGLPAVKKILPTTDNCPLYGKSPRQEVYRCLSRVPEGAAALSVGSDNKEQFLSKLGDLLGDSRTCYLVPGTGYVEWSSHSAKDLRSLTPYTHWGRARRD